MSSAAVLLGATCLTTVSFIVGLYISNARANRHSWADLVARLRPTEMPGVTLVALECINPQHSVLSTEPDDRMFLLGGMKGIRNLRWNANLLLALASHAEQWNLAESRRVATLIRAEGFALRRAVRLLMLATVLQASVDARSRYVQAVALCYYRMTNELQVLYNKNDLADARVLDSVIWSIN